MTSWPFAAQWRPRSVWNVPRQPRIAAVLQKQKPKVVWLEFQDCAGCTESFLRASHPTAAEVVLDVLSVDYHETIMAAAGHQAEAALAEATKNPGDYLCVVEGSIPTARGHYCTIGGHDALEIGARASPATPLATIAVGTCASFGGLPAAAPNPTGAMGVDEAVPGLKNLINLPGCPVNVENLTALVVHFLTFKSWPPLDKLKRPLFAYGKTIHDNCERRAHFDAGQYVEAWGDAAPPRRLLPLQDGLQGAGDLPQLPQRRLERQHQLAHRLRPPLHRLLGAGLLGSHDAVLRSPGGRPASASTSTATASAARRWWARGWRRTAWSAWPRAAPSSAARTTPRRGSSRTRLGRAERSEARRSGEPVASRMPPR